MVSVVTLEEREQHAPTSLCPPPFHGSHKVLKLYFILSPCDNALVVKDRDG